MTALPQTWIVNEEPYGELRIRLRNGHNETVLGPELTAALRNHVLAAAGRDVVEEAALLELAAVAPATADRVERIRQATILAAAEVSTELVGVICKIAAAGRMTAEHLNAIGREEIDTTPAMLALAKQAHAQALEERDASLSRWRPADPALADYVVYRLPAQDDDDGRAVYVFDERDPDATAQVQWERLCQSLTSPANSEEPGDVAPAVAHSYFITHPEPRPWHEAKAAELWVLTMDGASVAALADDDGGFVHMDAGRGTATIQVTDPAITAGRRVWSPAGEES